MVYVKFPSESLNSSGRIFLDNSFQLSGIRSFTFFWGGANLHCLNLFDWDHYLENRKITSYNFFHSLYHSYYLLGMNFDVLHSLIPLWDSLKKTCLMCTLFVTNIGMTWEEDYGQYSYKVKENFFRNISCRNFWSFLLWLGRRPNKWGTQWDSNSLVKVYQFSLLTITSVEETQSICIISIRKPTQHKKLNHSKQLLNETIKMKTIQRFRIRQNHKHILSCRKYQY